MTKSWHGERRTSSARARTSTKLLSQAHFPKDSANGFYFSVISRVPQKCTAAPRHGTTPTLVSGIRLGEDLAGINKVSQDTERSPLISSARMWRHKSPVSSDPCVCVSAVASSQQSAACFSHGRSAALWASGGCCHDRVMLSCVMWHVRDTSTVILWQVTLTISTSPLCPKLWLSSETSDKCQVDKWWTN